MPAFPSLAAAAPAARSWRDLLGEPPVLVAAGLVAYAFALVATLPARALLGHDATGTVWHGTVALPNGAAAEWNWLPIDSLSHGALSARWTVEGGQSLLTGIVRRPAFGVTEVADVTGSASWQLLAAIVPGWPSGCSSSLDVTMTRAASDGATGVIRTQAGTCSSGAGAIRSIPRLIATFAGKEGRITPWSDRTAVLATIRLGRGAIRIHTTPAGAAVLPGPGRSADLEMSL